MGRDMTQAARPRLQSVVAGWGACLSVLSRALAALHPALSWAASISLWETASSGEGVSFQGTRPRGVFCVAWPRSLCLVVLSLPECDHPNVERRRQVLEAVPRPQPSDSIAAHFARFSCGGQEQDRDTARARKGPRNGF